MRQWPMTTNGSLTCINSRVPVCLRKVVSGRMETPVSSKSPFLFDTGDIVPQGADDIWWRVIQSDEKEAILREVHCGVDSGHYVGDATTRKTTRSGLWWPTTLKDAIRYCKECNLCQRLGQPTKQPRMPHHPVLPLKSLQKWGLDFVGPFKPPTS